MKRRVVVTGMGIVSPLGNDVDEAYSNAVNGVSGIDLVEGFDTEDLKVKIAAQVKNFDPKKHIAGKDVRRQDLYSQYAVNAAMDAFIDAKLEGKYDHNRMGVILGTGMGGMGTLVKDLNRAFVGGYSKIPPMFIPMIIPNMASGNVSIALNAKAHVTTVTTACAAATNAIGDSFRLIRDGYADIMVTGGSEAAVNPYTLSGFAALTALSTNDDPKKASRPFDKNRDGFVLGEGCGILILEELEHALARNAHIYAEMVGYGATGDAYHITSPSGDGAVEAMVQALKDANIGPKEVSYLNAHGTSTPINDKYETNAIKEVFGDYANKLAISSTKSMHGHALGGTGAIEAILSIKAIEQGMVPPTINLETPDEECDLDYVANVARKMKVDVIMSNSLGFGGHNAVIVFRKYGDK